MTPIRSLLLAVSLAGFAAAGAMAQTFVNPSGQPPPPMMPLAQPPASNSQQECGAKFLPLRQEADKRGGTLKAAIDRKAERSELCNLFKSYSSAENAMLKFMETNQFLCSIPQNILTQVKTSQTRTAQLTKQVCSTAAAGPSGPPPPPSLSEALGTARAPTVSSPRTGSGGTFNTLTGAPPAR